MLKVGTLRCPTSTANSMRCGGGRQHRGGPLDEGDMEGTAVSRPRHEWPCDVTACENRLGHEMLVQRLEKRVERDGIQAAF